MWESIVVSGTIEEEADLSRVKGIEGLWSQHQSYAKTAKCLRILGNSTLKDSDLKNVQ